MSKEILGTDLKLEDGKDLTAAPAGDLEAVSGDDNLLQALSLRLNTPRGGLSHLGHPSYGSRLFELIGEPNNRVNRNLVKLYTLECLQPDPRVKEIRRVEVRTTPEAGRVSVHISVVPIERDVPLNLVFPFYFEPT